MCLTKLYASALQTVDENVIPIAKIQPFLLLKVAIPHESQIKEYSTETIKETLYIKECYM